jgi:hypothetical protein
MANVTAMQQLLLVSMPPFVFQIGVIPTCNASKKSIAGAPRQARKVEVEEAVLELLYSPDKINVNLDSISQII